MKIVRIVPTNDLMFCDNKNAAKDKHDSAGSKTQKLAQGKQGINKKTKSDLIKSRPTHN